MRITKTISIALFILLAATPRSESKTIRETSGERYDPSLFQTLKWRCIGPYRGGRATSVAGVPGQPLTFYHGTAGGGVWKTVDGGQTWRKVEKFGIRKAIRQHEYYEKPSERRRRRRRENERKRRKAERKAARG